MYTGICESCEMADTGSIDLRWGLKFHIYNKVLSDADCWSRTTTFTECAQHLQVPSLLCMEGSLSSSFISSVIHYWTPFLSPFNLSLEYGVVFSLWSPAFVLERSIQKIKYEMCNNPFSPLEGSSSLDFQSSITFLLQLTTEVITISKYYLQGLRIYIGGRVHRKK